MAASVFRFMVHTQKPENGSWQESEPDPVRYTLAGAQKKPFTKPEGKKGSRQESKSDPARYTSPGAQKKPFTKPLSKGVELSYQKDDYEVLEPCQDLYEETFWYNIIL